MRLVKNFLAFVIFIFSFSIFVSCGRNIDTGISENKEIRIVSLAPSNTEILVGLDLGNNIIGIDQYSEGIKGVSDSIELIGKSFNSVSKSKEMIESIKSSIEDIIGNNNSEKVSVYFEISQAPYLYSFYKC